MTRNAIVDALGVLKAGRIVDLTHLVHPGIQRFGPFPAMRIEPRYTVAESGFHVEQVSFVTQYGTHVDAPEHFVEGRRTLERIELEELMLPLFVLHFEDKVAADPEFIVHVDDIRRWEAEHGEIPAESFVAFSSGWYHRMEGGDMNNFDADGVAHSPGLGLDALKYLFEERGVMAVGHETLDTDGSADVRARGARLREVRARVRSLSGRGHGEPRQAALDGRRDLRGPPEVRQVPGLPGLRMGGRAKRGLSAADALSAARGSRGFRRARI